LRLEDGAMALTLGTPEGAASLAVEQRGGATRPEAHRSRFW
jgi:hypothetical protein